MTSPTPGHDRAPLRLVFVDDSRDAGESLGIVLELAGYAVTVSFDSVAALDLVRRLRPDAVISDIGMPRLTGFDLARALRADPSTDGIRLIAVSGYGRDDDRRQALEAGFDFHFIKPADLDGLRRAIDLR